MYNCNTNCNRLCPRFIPTTSISVVAVDGVDTLVLDIPDGTYLNNERYCIITLQTIPDTATVNMPVAISINGNTTTVYPLICNKTCLQATAAQMRPRTKYCTKVRANNVGGAFVAVSGLRMCCTDVIASLPVGGA